MLQSDYTQQSKHISKLDLYRSGCEEGGDDLKHVLEIDFHTDQSSMSPRDKSNLLTKQHSEFEGLKPHPRTFRITSADSRVNTSSFYSNSQHKNKAPLKEEKVPEKTEPQEFISKPKDTTLTRVDSTADESNSDMIKNLSSVVRMKLLNNMPPPLELNSPKQYSLRHDMAFGWRPTNVVGAPIPMYFNYEQPPLPMHPETKNDRPVYFCGKRYMDSLKMHRSYANKPLATSDEGIPSYHFKMPPKQNVIDALDLSNKLTRKQKNLESGVQSFVGNNPLLVELSVEDAALKFNTDTGAGKKLTIKALKEQEWQLKGLAGEDPSRYLLFESDFESGNLDMAFQVGPDEFDLYMRVDSNTRGHHQWFYFKIKNQKRVGTIRFNVVNFTKHKSLYMQGMRVNVRSELDVADKRTQGNQPNEGWQKSGENISYGLSKLSIPQIDAEGKIRKRYFQLTFDYTFKRPNDTVLFAYSVPYTVSKMHALVRSISERHYESFPTEQDQFLSQGKFCCTLSGFEVPILTITSQVEKLKFQPHGTPLLIDRNDYPGLSPLQNQQKWKKYVILAARVHPGESNSSFIMQGFLKFITGMSNKAQELRRQLVFKVIPMTNPDGVITGNYRTGLAGNDLNRQFISPNPKLHPTIFALKKLVKDVIAFAKQSEPILAFIDIHGHSRKKSAFMYGPSYPLHNERYFKCRVLPKLLNENTQMFRFYSCKFRIEKSKLRAARVVLFKEFGIMNCFTLESSFHGFIDQDRTTTEMTTEHFEQLGSTLGSCIHEYCELIEEDERAKQLVRERMERKKFKLKAVSAALKMAGTEDQLSDACDEVTSLNSVQTKLGTALRANSGTVNTSITGVHKSSGEAEERGKKNSRAKSLQGSVSEGNQSTTNLGLMANQRGNSMELITEEEVSVCRSEGSPTKQQRQSVKQGKKNARTKGGKKTMKELLKDIKRTKDDKLEPDDSDSSCDQSYCSADDLCAQDLKDLQGDILNVITQFERAYYGPQTIKEKRPPKAEKPKKRKIKESKETSKENQPKTKDQQPALPTQPFQLKFTGNGGNPSSMALGKIMQERLERQVEKERTLQELKAKKGVSDGMQTIKSKKSSIHVADGNRVKSNQTAGTYRSKNDPLQMLMETKSGKSIEITEQRRKSIQIEDERKDSRNLKMAKVSRDRNEQVEPDCLNDPQIIFVSKEPESLENNQFLRRTKEQAQFRVRSKRMALINRGRATTTQGHVTGLRSADVAARTRANIHSVNKPLQSAGIKNAQSSLVRTPKLTSQDELVQFQTSHTLSREMLDFVNRDTQYSSQLHQQVVTISDHGSRLNQANQTKDKHDTLGEVLSSQIEAELIATRKNRIQLHPAINRLYESKKMGLTFSQESLKKVGESNEVAKFESIANKVKQKKVKRRIMKD